MHNYWNSLNMKKFQGNIKYKKQLCLLNFDKDAETIQ